MRLRRHLVAVDHGEGERVSVPRFLFLAVMTSSPAGKAGPEFHWRLVGGNNHVLGRCPAAFGDLERCQEAVTRLVADVDEAVPSAGPTSRPGGWTWQLSLTGEGAGADGQVVAVSARGYERQRECHYSLDNFLLAVPAADVVSRVAVRAPTREVSRMQGGAAQTAAGLRGEPRSSWCSPDGGMPPAQD